MVSERVIVNADHCNVVMSAVFRSSFVAVSEAAAAAAHLASTLLVVERHVSDQLGLRSSLGGAQSRGSRALLSSRSNGLPGIHRLNDPLHRCTLV